jgi:ubiquinol-cytochrome c reductase iron-sulfur subunit
VTVPGTTSLSGVERVDEDQQPQAEPAEPAEPAARTRPGRQPARAADPLLSRDQQRAARIVAACFVVATLAGVALFFVYFAGGNTQLEGILFAVALGAFGIGIATWGATLLAVQDAVEDRHEFTTGEEGRLALVEAFEEEAGPLLRQGGRRSFLVRLLVGAAGALGLALLLPALSLGPAPGRSLSQTSWRAGKRVVDENGEPVAFDSLPTDGFLTVFPEGEDVNRADSQALLIRVPPDLLELPEDRLNAVPGGTHVCYSKICSHAGCPVGLYRAETRSLICPCHQSQFDVLRGAKPYFGPAARPLPQLPISVDPEGYLVALGDFYEPVGPAFWHRVKRGNSS